MCESIIAPMFSNQISVETGMSRVFPQNNGTNAVSTGQQRQNEKF